MRLRNVYICFDPTPSGNGVDGATDGVGGATREYYSSTLMFSTFYLHVLQIVLYTFLSIQLSGHRRIDPGPITPHHHVR